MTPAEIATEIAAERDRQRTKWVEHSWGSGDCSSDEVAAFADTHDTNALLRLAVLHEEAGEVARAVMERDDEHLRAELVQVAAVCHAWLESMTA